MATGTAPGATRAERRPGGGAYLRLALLGALIGILAAGFIGLVHGLDVIPATVLASAAAWLTAAALSHRGPRAASPSASAAAGAAPGGRGVSGVEPEPDAPAGT